MGSFFPSSMSSLWRWALLQLCFFELSAYRIEDANLMAHSNSFTPAEHKKLISADLVTSHCLARKLDLCYKAGVGEPDDAALQYKGSGAEMKFQAKDQFMHSIFGKKKKSTDTNSTEPERPNGVNPINAPRSVAQHFHGSPPPLAFNGCGKLLEADMVKGDKHFAAEALNMLEGLYADIPDVPSLATVKTGYPPVDLAGKVDWWFGNEGKNIKAYIPTKYQPRGLVTNRQFRNQVILQTQQLFCNAFASSPEYFWQRAGHIMHMLTDTYSNSHVVRKQDADFELTTKPDTSVDVFMTMDGELWEKHVRADSPVAARVMGATVIKKEVNWQRKSARWMSVEATSRFISAFEEAYTGEAECPNKPVASGKELKAIIDKHLPGFVKAVVCAKVAKMDEAKLGLPAGGVWVPGLDSHVDFKYSSIKTAKGKQIPWVPIGLGTEADLQDWVDNVNTDLEPIRKHHADGATGAFAYADDLSDYCALDSSGEQLAEPFTCQTTDFEAEDSVAFIDMAKQQDEVFLGGRWMTDLLSMKKHHAAHEE